MSSREENRPANSAGSQPAWPAQHASVLLKSISSTTRPRSNNSASAEPGASRGFVIAAVYEKRRRQATGEPMSVLVRPAIAVEMAILHSAPIAQRLDQQRKGRRRLAAARVVKVIA